VRKYDIKHLYKSCVIFSKTYLISILEYFSVDLSLD